MKLDAKSETKIIGLQASFQMRLRTFFLLCKSIGWTPFSHVEGAGFRSAAQQNHMHKLNKNNPPAGNSSHEQGRALDLNFKKGGVTLLKATPKDTWVKSGIPGLMALCGLRWGGNFSTYFDPVHVDDL